MNARHIDVILCLSLAALALAAAPARGDEVARTFAALQGRVLIGETVTVTDQAGQVAKGKLTSISPTELTLNTNTGLRTFVGNDLVKVQARRSGPLWNGALIGAAVGATPFIIAASQDECDGCGPWAAIYTAIGAGVGVGIDALVKGNITVMKLEPQGGKATVSLAPLIARDRKGVLCSLSF
jgi:hypothetical protein